LLTFGEVTTIASSIDDRNVTRQVFIERVDRLPRTYGNTYAGNALDIARIKQFL